MVRLECLSTRSWLEILGHGHTQLCASLAVTLHMISGICCIMGYPSILMHHLVLLICFTLALYRNVTINYLILTLICKLHSIFLHVRKARWVAGIRDARSKIVRAEWVLNWVTFTFARTAAHLLVTAKLFCDAPKFGKGIELPLALFGMFGMNFLNASLGIDLFHAFKRERNSQHANAYHE